jgi:hypothetical protein
LWKENLPRLTHKSYLKAIFWRFLTAVVVNEVRLPCDCNCEQIVRWDGESSTFWVPKKSPLKLRCDTPFTHVENTCVFSASWAKPRLFLASKVKRHHNALHFCCKFCYSKLKLHMAKSWNGMFQWDLIKCFCISFCLTF